MGEQIPLLSLPPTTIQPITDPIRQNIESKLDRFPNESIAKIIGSINTRTRGNAIQWDAVIKDLESASGKFNFVSLKLFLPGFLTSMTLNAGASMYGTVSTISNVDYESNTSKHDRLVNDLCIAPNLLSSLFSGCAALLLLIELISYKEHFLLKSPEFKQLLNDVNQAQSSDHLLELMSSDNDFSKSQKQLIEHAKISSLLGNGTIHPGAFKFALKETYPASNMLLSCLAGVAIFNAISGFCIVPDHQIIGLAPLFFNLASIFCLPVLIGEPINRKEVNFSGIIRTIRDDLANQPQIIESQVVETKVTKINVINEEV
jgi:hypothetical protein